MKDGMRLDAHDRGRHGVDEERAVAMKDVNSILEEVGFTDESRAE